MLIEPDELFHKLIARLPELEWKLNGLGMSFLSHSLPKGLFRITSESTAALCIAEIKADIHALSKQTNKRSAFYLAERIRQKINVLVVLCQIHHRKNKPEGKSYFGIKMLSTRQQWINDLEIEIDALSTQRQAMIKSLAHLQCRQDSDALLNLKAELGEVERSLTLAKETLNRAVSS
ncbi:coiled-coil protein [Legionella gratiana]|uniref:Coiled-coil protein n=1 Tax=Legionella gratiana TaxID=45066 RepID=A0A378J486_9GAMM|nr:hypothetical protein [Legionella gratiana]KTD05881.1 coiled-coil protein [Legionella gratiana]STX42319.1 coiled-coil protein [Legionella gratiana]